MDAVAYSLASKQAQRIEKFIENPDSASGIVTVPKTIASGETVTVPAGRVAVLPNVQVDGTLNVEGDVFIPSGSSVDFSSGIKVNGEKLTMSIPTAYHIYNGSVEATNTVLTNGFSTTLYTGNGGTQAINTGVDMATQWGDDASETFGGLVWRKARSQPQGNQLSDTVRGATFVLGSESTSAQSIVANSLTSFNNNGFSVGSWIGDNQNGTTYASWNFQTTHRKTGVTNHGKAYTEHYNPFTGFTIIKYEGSGLAGHEIPHSLGRKLGFVTIKNLTSSVRWQSFTESHYMFLNEGTAGTSPSNTTLLLSDNSSILGSANSETNTSTNQYIMYGWANSYFDEDNTLIGNYEIGVYQGTGVAGNKVKTRGKPAWVMIKRLDSAENWVIIDNQRNAFDSYVNPNLSGAEAVYDHIDINVDGFTFKQTGQNVSGGQFLYMVVYDNGSGSGKSKYPKATDTTNLSINALVPYANGIDVNGSKVSIEYKNETITGLTLTQGKNYPYSKNDGTYGVNKYEPMYGSLRDRVMAGENPDYFDLKTMKWYGTTGGKELVTNGTFDVDTTGWTATTGFIISVQSNSLKMDRNITTPTGGVYQNISTIIGKKYKVTLDVIYISGGGLTIWVDSGNILSTYITTTGKHVVEFIANNSLTKLDFLQSGVAQTGTINLDNISVFEAEPTIGAEITPRTYLDCVVYADHNGQVSYVEELPKTTYFDEIKANEFKGKNACTAWVTFDGTTTPPTIRDNYNVATIIRTATGVYDIYFKTEMDNVNYTVSVIHIISGANMFPSAYIKYKNKLTINTFASNGALMNAINIDVQIFGGKN